MAVSELQDPLYPLRVDFDCPKSPSPLVVSPPSRPLRTCALSKDRLQEVIRRSSENPSCSLDEVSASDEKCMLKLEFLPEKEMNIIDI